MSVIIGRDFYDELKEHFIDKKLASPILNTYPVDKNYDVRFADLGDKGDIITKSGAFRLIILNNYADKESYVITFMTDGHFGYDMEEFKVETIDEFSSIIKKYRSYTNAGKGVDKLLDMITDSNEKV